jgi:hypothetical protein
VAGDTLAYMPDRHEVRPLGFIQKVLPLPHLKAVLFSRGQYQILVTAYAGLLLIPQLIDIEDAAAALPAALQAATAWYCEQQGISEDPTSVGLLEAVLLGWSEREKRTRCWQFMNMRSYQAEDVGECYGMLAFPRIPAKYQHAVKGAPTDRDLVRAVEAAGRYFVGEPEINCGARVGGEITCFDITPRGLTYRTLHKFADYEQTRHAAAAIVARIGRGELDIAGLVRDGLVPIDQCVDSETGEKLVA